ncbi:hypothetical protein BJ912DRAFT_1148679 [Pholiota molesta]|nr:hypothetical protein BJ912DRAFT_1148679 [Pholiota molesta]
MSSNYAQESSGSGRQGVQAASARENATVPTVHRAVNTSDIDACERDNTHSGYGGHNPSSDRYGHDTSLDKYAQTMGGDHPSRGSASGNISASIMEPSSAGPGGAGSASGLGAGHREGEHATCHPRRLSRRHPRPAIPGTFPGLGDTSAAASANAVTSCDESGAQAEMHRPAAPQDEFIGECHQPGCATCWSTGHYDVSLDPAAAAAGHRTIGHHTTDQRPIGHHVDTSAMGGGSWGTHPRALRGGAGKWPAMPRATRECRHAEQSQRLVHIKLLSKIEACLA